MKTLPVLAFVVSCTALPLFAQNLQDERVRFKLGQPVTIKAALQGETRIEYLVNGAVAQGLVVNLQSSPGVFFDVLEPGAETPIFVGSRSGNDFQRVLTRSGDHRVRVYLSPEAAQRGEPVKYTLRITVEPGT